MRQTLQIQPAASQVKQRLSDPYAPVSLELRPKTDSPQWTGSSPDGKAKELQIEYLYPDPETGEPLGKVVRKQWTDRRPVYGIKRDTKQVRPEHWATLPGDPAVGWWSDRGKGPKVWPLYRQQEVQAENAAGIQTAFQVAGEQAVETMRAIGLSAFTNQGGEGNCRTQTVEFVKGLELDQFVVLQDNDAKGQDSSQKLARACTRAGIPTVVIDLRKIWPDLPPKGDITDVVTSSGMDTPTLIERLEAEIHAALKRERSQQRAKAIGTVKTPKPVVIAAELAEKYRDRLCFDTESKRWHHYGLKQQGVWQPMFDEEVELVVQAELDQRQDTAGNYGFSYVVNILRLLSARLLVKEWNEQPGLLPLQNGVLELSTRKLLPHSPGYRFRWCLPFDFNPLETCNPIEEWLLEVMNGDRSMVELLRAYLSAIVKGRTDLQRFLECVGPGGTGKSTLILLATALVGQQNTFSTELKHLENNRFEPAGIYGKRLVVVTDSERYGGSVAVFKALTGGDMLRYERKGIQQGNGFVPTAMVMLAANETVQSSDYTSGLERRRLTVPFTHQVAPEKRRDLQSEFKPYLPGLLNWVLDISDERVTELVRNTARSVPSLRRMQAETLCEANPLAAWLDARVIYTEGAETFVGTREFRPEEYLYPSYATYCEATGSKPVALNRFSSLLLDLCRSQLHLEVTKQRDRQRGAFFTGLKLRSQFDTDPNPVTERDALETDYETVQTLTGDERDVCDALFDVQSQKENNECDRSSNKPVVGNEKAKSASRPSRSSPARLPAITEPSRQPESASRILKSGDRVQIDFPGLKRHGKAATVKHLKESRGVQLADVLVDGERRNWEVQVSGLRPLEATRE